jgi:proline racemase
MGVKHFRERLKFIYPATKNPALMTNNLPLHNWQPSSSWRTLTTIDAHTGGEPLRIITGGWPPILGDTILAKRAYAREQHDDLRRALMWEPRGHADMYGAIFTEPVTPDGDVGVLFLHNAGFSTMCGHGIIALVKVGVDIGYFDVREDPTLRIDTPAGRVTATAHLHPDGTCARVSFENVPSFLLARDLTVAVPGYGDVTCDIAYGGGFYAYVNADALGVQLDDAHQQDCINAGRAIKHAVMDQYTITHPTDDPDLNFLYGTILVSHTQQADPAAHSRNVCIFADGEVDRSPTGTGVSGRVAIHHARGELADETITVESIIGSQFTGRVVKTTQVGDVPAVIPEISGTAHITGVHTFMIDPDDPLRDGFILR